MLAFLVAKGYFLRKQDYYDSYLEFYCRIALTY